MKTYPKKTKEGEILIYEEILNSIADIYNPTFSLLVLPKAHEIDKEGNHIVLPFYEGERFNEKWDERTAGSLMGTDLATEIPEILKELATIDIAPIVANEKIQSIPKLTFNTEQYLPEFDILAERIRNTGRLSQEEIDQARVLIQQPFSSPLIFNNGDFYPRNFIRLPDKKIVLIDWETWDGTSRANIIDHPENVAAFCFVHMWNNPVWQKVYIQALKKNIPMKKEDFQRAVLIKSLEMANHWLREGEKEYLLMCDRATELFRNMLDPEYVEALWNQ